jgi:hypothetical protein
MTTDEIRCLLDYLQRQRQGCENAVFKEMDTGRSDPCRAITRAQGKDLPAGKGDRLGLCQPGDWKTILAWTLTGTLPGGVAPQGIMAGTHSV